MAAASRYGVGKPFLRSATPRFTAATRKGKLIVVLEEASQGAVGAKADAISGLPHVLSATMVFQASDDDEGRLRSHT